MAGIKTHTRRLDRSNYSVGDSIWVKETWRPAVGYEDVRPSEIPEDEQIVYLEDCLSHPEKHLIRYGIPYNKRFDCRPWRPSIFMPRRFSRILLSVVDVWSEPLQAITEEDAIKEGIEKVGPCWKDYRKGGMKQIMLQDPRDSFRTLWNSINGKKPGCSWKDNPIVNVTEFKLLGVKNGKEND